MKYFLDFSKQLETEKPGLNSHQRQKEVEGIMMERASQRMVDLRGPDNKNILQIAQMFGIPLDSSFQFTDYFW